MSNIQEEKINCPHCYNDVLIHYRCATVTPEFWLAPGQEATKKKVKK